MASGSCAAAALASPFRILGHHRLMVSTLLSRMIGLVRAKYIAYLFGAGPQTDAYLAAFTLPDMIAYFLVGGTASIAFIAILRPVLRLFMACGKCFLLQDGSALT